jgi:serine protease AprX
VIAVGASEGNTTYTADDDSIAPFSNCGTSSRHVDLVAPGKSIVSLRSPGSYADQSAPKAVVDERFFVGSGTSQAAAVVSGGVALLLEQRPELTPDQVKDLLMDTAQPILSAGTLCQGAGQIDLKIARDTAAKSAGRVRQSHTQSTGSGSLEAARGTMHVFDEGVALTGEQDIMGNAWNGYCTKKGKKITCTDTLWDGGDFNGASWSGASWSGASWSGASWSGASWSGASWSGASWSAKTWSGASWSGASWSGASWSGSSWSGASWSGDVWSGLSWE